MTCGSSTCECATALPNALTAISDNPIANLIKRVALSCMTIFHNLVGETRPEECDGRHTADTSKQAERGAD